MEQFRGIPGTFDGSIIPFEGTPGPWNINNDIGSGKLIIYGRCLRIATTHTPASHWVARADAEANTRLIAAAPELLEALQELLSYVQPYILGNGQTDYTVFLKDKCSKAINKALGKEVTS